MDAAAGPGKGIRLKYTSSAKMVLTIDSKGKYKARALGKARVTIKAYKGSRLVAKKTVTDGALTEYRVFFDTLEKGRVPTLVRGGSSKEITPGQLIYRNMELDAGNDEVAPYFEEASKLLQNEMEGLFQ